MKSQSTRGGEYCGFDEIKKVAILLDYSGENEKIVRELMGRLSSMNIFCAVASYFQGKSGSILREDFVYFSDRDINVMGVPKDAALSRFLDCEYDVLFDLRDKACVVSDYVHRSVKRKFSVGNNTSIEVNDITFNTANDISSFSNNIIDYLKKLKKA